MKRKVILPICLAVVFLAGCQNAENNQEIEEAQVEAIRTPQPKETDCRVGLRPPRNDRQQGSQFGRRFYGV